LLFGSFVSAFAAEPQWSEIGPSDADNRLEAYFRARTAELTRSCLRNIETIEDWQQQKDRYRQKLFEMLGLDPLPERTPLRAQVTGRADHEAFRVENVHFQSRPGLYVTGNLYVPKERDEKLPAILYVCGHGRIEIDGVSYGNKAHFQHHGGWFARNGYVCLTIDTLQLGEIEGIHHGTYREKMWWWNARGYTSAGVEAWNCIRALDYLQSRAEVDPERIGVTGRSGGGAYSWWVAALDDRIKAAVPVAGIASLKNHVVDGCVEGHCDCMFMVNTYRWDFPLVAALVAPRPLLISNTDKDRIFPLDGVVDVYNKTRRIYELYGKLDNIGLQICEGPHKDTQELRVHAFHWFNKFLKGEDPLIETTAVKYFEPQSLKVFDEPPSDERNTTIQDSFTATAVARLPDNEADWAGRQQEWMYFLRAKTFGGWPSFEPASHGGLAVKAAFSAESDGVQLSAYDFTSEEPGIVLRMFIAHQAGLPAAKFDAVVLKALDEPGWQQFLATMQPAFVDKLQVEPLPGGDASAFAELVKSVEKSKTAIAFIAPRGIGTTAWNSDEGKRTQIRRRFVLLGQTRDGMRVWDVARAAAAVRSIATAEDLKLTIHGERQMAGIALYASLFTPRVTRLELVDLPSRITRVRSS
jgi:dienelactone hydrolase